jgi:hypothetical protein
MTLDHLKKSLNLKIMKTLTTILMLMLCMGVFGQYKEGGGSLYYFDDNNLSENDPLNDPIRQFRTYQTFCSYESLLSDWSEYKQECYADSLLVHAYDPMTSIFPNTCYAYELYMEIRHERKLICEDASHFTWKHKKPTFEGFMNYIETKYRVS